MAAPTPHWNTEPEDHDFPAASDYLSLVVPDQLAQSLTDALRRAGTIHRKAKDLLRASELALLPANNPHVAADLDKVKKGKLLSPVLLVRGELGGGVRLTVADGYHRICASYTIDENADIPCRMVDFDVLRGAKH
jgi:hypothetical protein